MFSSESRSGGVTKAENRLDFEVGTLGSVAKMSVAVRHADFSRVGRKSRYLSPSENRVTCPRGNLYLSPRKAVSPRKADPDRQENGDRRMS